MCSNVGRARRGGPLLALTLAACVGAAGDAGRTAGANAPVVIPAGDGATSAPADTLPARDTVRAGDTIPGASKGTGGRPTPLPMPPEPADPADRGRGAADDTARGVVAVVGAAPLTEIVLRRAAGGALRLAGAHVPALRRLAGVELWVRGTPVAAPRPSIDVAQFAVRAVDGVPALDGVLADERGRVVLVTADGRRQALEHPPAELRDQVGARVWITGTTPGEVASYGIIRPPSGN